MDIVLKLWEDQPETQLHDTNSTIWEMFVNGQAFPSSSCNLVTLSQAHSIAFRIMDIEEELSE